jgi:hypothetical protein
MLAKQEAFDSNIFVEVGPMYSITCPAYLKISAFLRRAICETRIPPDWNRDGSTVLEID